MSDGISAFFEGGTGIGFEVLEGFNAIQEARLALSLNESFQDLIGVASGIAEGMSLTQDETFVDPVTGRVFRIPTAPRSGNIQALYPYQCGPPGTFGIEADQRTINYNRIRIGDQLCPTRNSVTVSAATGSATNVVQDRRVLDMGLPMSNGGQVMGFFDDFGSVIGSIGTTVLEGAGALGGFVLNNAGAIAQTVQAVNQLLQSNSSGSSPTFANAVLAGGQGGLPAMQTGMMMVVNPDTGSLVQQFAGALGGIINAARGSAGAVLGGAAGGAALEGASSLLGSLFGAGGGGFLGPVPRDPVTGRRLSSVTFMDERTGRPVIYKSQGACVLSSADLAGSRRTQRVARRAARGRRRQARLPPIGAGVPMRSHVVCGGCLTSPCGCK